MFSGTARCSCCPVWHGGAVGEQADGRTDGTHASSSLRRKLTRRSAADTYRGCGAGGRWCVATYLFIWCYRRRPSSLPSLFYPFLPRAWFWWRGFVLLLVSLPTKPLCPLSSSADGVAVWTLGAGLPLRYLAATHTAGGWWNVLLRRASTRHSHLLPSACSSSFCALCLLFSYHSTLYYSMFVLPCLLCLLRRDFLAVEGKAVFYTGAPFKKKKGGWLIATPGCHTFPMSSCTL